MKKLLFTIALLGASVCLLAQTWQPADPDATPEAKQLFERLQKIQKKGTMFGHQDDLVTGSSWNLVPGSSVLGQLGNSDTKDAVGDYPGVVGFELGELELGQDHSLDNVYFDIIRDRAKWFHEQGGIITVSWHVVNPISSQWPGVKEPNGAGSAWEVDFLSASGQNAVKSVLPGGCNNAMFNSWLDKLAKFFLSWKDKDGNLIPFLFRPYHEHSGSFFWWGKTRCYDEEYAELWRYTVKYLRAKGLHNILYMYNTDKVYSPEEYLAGYPGDEYIDVMSIDWYGSGEEFNTNVTKALTFTTQLAQQHGKLHALSECGPLSEDLQKILANFESSYVLIWRNAPRIPRVNPTQEILGTPAPMANGPQMRRPQGPSQAELLQIMKKNKNYLFLEDVKKIK